MKKTLLSSLTLLLATSAAFCQFTDKGYKDFKLGITVEEAQKIVNFKLDNEDGAIIKYDGISLYLTFTDNMLWVVRSNSKATKVKGENTALIGKSLKEVQSILGSKLKVVDYMGEQSYYWFYYADDAAKDNYETSCILHFGDDGILHTVFAAYNP